MAELADLLATNYRLGLRQIRDSTADSVAGAYGAIEPDAIGDTFHATFAPLAAERIEAGQAAAETLTTAYASLAGQAEPAPGASLAGRTYTGMAILANLPGILAMVLAGIREGRPVLEALGLGQYLALRFADNELSRVADATLERNRGKAIGWRGITHNPQDACIGNAGVHPFSVPMYRHGGCRCERVLVFA